MRYVGLKCVNSGNEARFGLPRSYEDSFELCECMPLAGQIPKDAGFRMSDDFPDQLALPDVAFVLANVLVVNVRVRDLLARRGTPDIEFLEVAMINHKGRRVKESFFVVNLLRAIDCVDRSKTMFRPSALTPANMTRVQNLTLDEARIDPAVQIFRPVGLKPLMVARRDLAEHLTHAKVTGLGVFELSGYKS